MANHFNSLTEAESERLSLLAEECSEVIQAITKIQRHGYESRTNRIDLAAEIGHVEFAVSLMLGAGDIERKNIDLFYGGKEKSVWDYLHHNFKSPIYAKKIEQ